MENLEGIMIEEGNLLERIRQRPPMYLGKRSLSALSQFFAGYHQACRDIGAESPHFLPQDFHDWVAYRLHFCESTSGYTNMILKHTPDEAQALVRFFELLDEHRARKATAIATIRRHPQDYKIIWTGRLYIYGGQASDGKELAQAEEALIVRFTDDPGFFVMSNDPFPNHTRPSVFYPSLSWINKPYRADREFTTVLNQEQWERLQQEEVAFEQARREEDVIRKRRVAEEQDKHN
jgi:hypothetical protein